MGQKTNPIANRLGNIMGWQSSWCGDYRQRIEEDHRIRQYIDARLVKSGVSRVYIERTLRFITITLTTSRPALVIGKGGDEVDKLKNELKRITKKEVQINILEIKRPELDAPLVAKSIARQIESRASYKKAIKQAIMSAIRMNAEGIKIQVSGRLNGAEMSRTEHYKEGSISLSTFRVDVDYATSEAHTVSGRIGVKVWIKKEEVYGSRELSPLTGLQKKQKSPTKLGSGKRRNDTDTELKRKKIII
ncbi:MAG: 30S ribosomal protein S3 [Flavobacteriales bacterium AspAUS03]